VAGDVAKWASFYTDDAVVLAPDAPPVQGKANMQKWAEPMLKDKPEVSFNVAKIEVARSGDLAYEWGTARMASRQEGQGHRNDRQVSYRVEEAGRRELEGRSRYDDPRSPQAKS